MENTEDLEIDIDDIGTILKSSRLKQKKSMEEISSELCIRKIYLTALEEGDYETLPPIPYGIGYVRTYARYLGLNPERAVKLYKTASSTVEEEKEEDVKEVSEVNKSGGRHIIAGILALALVYGGWSWYTSTSETTISENIKEDVLIEDDTSTFEALDDVSVNQTVLEESELENTNESTVVPVNEVTPTVVNETVEEEQPVAVENDMVTLEFTGESWVELKDKNKVHFQGVFHKGDKKEMKYTDNLFLSVGRPHNVTVYIKGDKKNILVKRRKMNIPLDSLN